MSDLLRIIASNLASGIIARTPIDASGPAGNLKTLPDAQAKEAVRIYDSVLTELHAKYGMEMAIESAKR